MSQLVRQGPFGLVGPTKLVVARDDDVRYATVKYSAPTDRRARKWGLDAISKQHDPGKILWQVVEMYATVPRALVDFSFCIAGEVLEDDQRRARKARRETESFVLR